MTSACISSKQAFRDFSSTYYIVQKCCCGHRLCLYYTCIYHPFLSCHALSFACTRYSNYDTQLISVSFISGVSSYVINDRLFPVLLHSSSGEDSLGVRCPVCEGKYSHDEPPTRFVRSVPAKLNPPPSVYMYTRPSQTRQTS